MAAFSSTSQHFVFLLVVILKLSLINAEMKGPNLQPSFSTGGDFTRFSLPEDTKVGTVVYRLKGNDPENGELIYSISGEYFRVNKRTGDLTLIKELDREVESSIDVIISLTDDGNGGEPETVSLRREILITDVNDNPPVFHKKPYSFRISEKANPGSTVQSDIIITDDDFEKNAEIKLTCVKEESPIACETFEVSAERIGEGNYVGIISLAMPLDFEKHSSYALTLNASDGLNSVQATVHLIVIDHQDEPPRFFEGPYVFQVKENSWPGTFIGNISVQDGDNGNPRELQIKLIDEARNNYFRLTSISRDSFTGTYSAIVETSEAILDAEDDFIRQNLGVYELTLEAREIPLNNYDIEPTQTTRIGLAIIIQDQDDNLPIFTPSHFTDTLYIPYNEDESYIFPNFNVEIEDVDIETKHSIFNLQFDWNLELEESGISVDEVFAFITPDNTNPIIQSKGAITLEVLNVSLLQPGSNFDLIIGAYQQSVDNNTEVINNNNKLLTKLTIPIQVAPHGKILPIFNSTIYRVSVLEDIKPGELITRINIENHKAIPHTKYNIIGDSINNFYINESSGEIRCAMINCIDYEKDKQHFFLIKAKSGNTIEDEAFALLYFDAIETNDNNPRFIETDIKRTVPDESIKFDPPLFINAIDDDLNDRITYSVIDYSMNSSGIYIEPESGELKLGKPLRWAEVGEHKLMVRATDKTGKFTEQNVLVIVQPVPNMRPYFKKPSYHADISETLPFGSSILQVHAHDPDGRDIALKYYIEPQKLQQAQEIPNSDTDLFLMEEATGILKLNGKLDYEAKQRFYEIKIRVQDEGKPTETGWTIATINILDENDEKPIFEQKHYVIEMSETEKVDFNLITIKAIDSDINSTLKYSLICNQNLTNDEIEEFNYCQSWDSSGSKANEKLSKQYFQHLKINSKTGEINLIKTLLHKSSSVLEFTVFVEDLNGISPQNDSATITIYVTAAERLLPFFGEPWTPANPWINLTVPEDMEIGRNVVTLNAWDYVADEEITEFVLVDENNSDPFDLEDNVLKVISPLDYETKKEYIVSVKAIDTRGGESIAHVFLNISDVNDHTPVFEKTEYKGKVLENSNFPTPILTVQASDRDDVLNYGSIRYHLSGPQSTLFTIDELAGVIQVAPNAIIDREKDSSHTIYVLAMDTPAGGPFQRTATATLKIEVEDENDNDPICIPGNFLIPENVQIGTIVGNISCTDLDENTSLIYTFKDESQLGLFTINSKTGTITTIKSLRARGRSSPYLFSISVEDGGGGIKDRPQHVIVPLTITVTNVIPNDGKPYFTNLNLTAFVSEGSFRGTPILHLTAEDFDSYDNGEGRLFFKLMKQIYPCNSKINSIAGHASGGKKASSSSNNIHVQDVNFFKLDEQTGMLSLFDTIDREKYECFSILVSVEDLGTPSQSQVQWFEIQVTDIDDNLPYIDKSQQIINLVINETTPIDSTILNLGGIDKDIKPNNIINFELIGTNINTPGFIGTDYFKLVQTTDQNISLVVKDDLEQITIDEFSLGIKCYGGGGNGNNKESKELIKKIGSPDCISKIHITLNRDSPVLERIKVQELIFGAAGSIPIGNLLGNVEMTPFKPIYILNQMFYPNHMSMSPLNLTSEIIHIDSTTGDIFVWDNLESYLNGHIRIDLSHDKNLQFYSNQKKRLKIFVTQNKQLLSADLIDFTKLQKWINEIEIYLNEPLKPNSRISKGFFRFLVFDVGNAADGKTKICFQLLENENQVSQEKALQLLNNPEILEIFTKYTFTDEIQKGCPEQPRVPLKLVVSGSTAKTFWVERSLVGIASVIIIATMSAILILCLIHRNKGKDS